MQAGTAHGQVRLVPPAMSGFTPMEPGAARGSQAPRTRRALRNRFGSWGGPWFASPQKPERLRRPADVLRVRRSHGVLWLATGTDVFAYHESSKTMRLLLEDAASAEIESVPDGTRLATSKFLYLHPASRADQAATVKVDSVAVSQLRISPSGDTVAYKARPENEPEIYRAAVRPFSNTLNVS